MANDKFYLADNKVGLINLKDAAGQAVIDATVTVSVFDNYPLSIGSADSPIQEVQTLIPNAKSTAGTFKLGYHGQWTIDLAFDASLAAIKTALEVLTNIAVDDVVVGGELLNAAGFATGMTFTFARKFGQAFMLDFDFSGLTGPSQNLSYMTETTKGISEGVALDLGSGKVGIPVPGIVDVYTNMFVRIVGTRNYNGQWEVDPLLSTKSRLAIINGKSLVLMTAANPSVVTTVLPHGLTTGTFVIVGATGTDAAFVNTTHTIASVTDNTITTTTNLSGKTFDVSSARIVAYAYEEFDGRDLVYFGALNGKDIVMTYSASAPVGYWGIIPNTLAGFVANETAVMFVKAVSGAVQRVFQAKPTIYF